MRPSTTRRDLEARADALIDALAAGQRQPRGPAAAARPSSTARRCSPTATSSIVERGGRYRVRERTVLRYYARTIQHLLVPRRAVRTH